MKHEEFQIGVEFWCGGNRWRCTDLGTRVIVAICLEPHEVVSLETDADAPSGRKEYREVTDDPFWFEGPPYPVVEYVFDEYSIESCSLTAEEEAAPLGSDG